MNERRMNQDTLEICVNGEVVLTIQEAFIEDAMRMKIAGEIINEAAHEFEDEIMAALSVCPRVELDLGGVTYIASFAMKALLSIQRIVDEGDGGALTLRNLSCEVKEIFEASGFMDILDVEV